MKPDEDIFRSQSLVKNRIRYSQYDKLVAKLLDGEPLPRDLTFGDP